MLFSISWVNAQHLNPKIDSLNNLSFELRVSGMNRSIELSKEAIRLNKDQSYKWGLYKSYLNLGINFTNLGRYDSALILLKKSDEYFEKPFEKGLVKYYLGICHSNLRNFDKSKSYLMEAESLFINNKLAEYQAYVQNSLGIIEGRQANYDKALSYFLKGYEIKIENDFNYDEELANISIVYRLMGNFSKALEFAKKSLSICYSLNDSLGIAQTYVSIGKIYGEMKVYDSAFSSFDASYSIAKQMNFANQMSSSLINKSILLNELGKMREAIETLEMALAVGKGDEYIEESVSAELANAYQSLEEWNNAIKHAEKTYRSAAKSNNVQRLVSSSQILSNAYGQIGDLVSALEYAEKQIQHLDSLHSQTSEAEVGDLRVRIETLEKDHEISLLQKEKEVEKLRRDRLVILMVAVLLVSVAMVSTLVFWYRGRLKKKDADKRLLQNEIERGKEDLYKQTLHMIHVNNCLDDIEYKLVDLSPEDFISENKKILNTIRLNKSLDKDWQNFNEYFGNVHSSFFEKLNTISSDLSNHDCRVCSLLKLGLSNREIATILNIEVKSVSMVKYRIKKKMELEDDVDLASFVQKI